jgi:hypothetical protein
MTSAHVIFWLPDIAASLAAPRYGSDRLTSIGVKYRRLKSRTRRINRCHTTMSTG